MYEYPVIVSKEAIDQDACAPEHTLSNLFELIWL
jgi:hypothetical protein